MTLEEHLYRNFQIHFPAVAVDAVEYVESAELELTITLVDGSKVIYDDLKNSLRTPRDLTDMEKAFLPAEELNRNFGRNLRRRMYIMGYNQKRLAVATSISEQTLSAYMTGQSQPLYNNVLKLAAVLECDIRDFSRE